MQTARRRAGVTGPPARAVPSREIVLDFLKRRHGTWVSGQLLAEQVAMTRTAVWKHIGSLRAEGYEIEALPNLGYRLLGIPDALLVPEIRDGLRTRIMGQPAVRRFVRMDSTNMLAKEMAAAGAAEGTLVIAEEQTQGRGRLDRRWFSPAGRGIYASVILRPSIPPEETTRIALCCAVTVAEALRDTTGLPARIKWPNDVLVGGRKIAGILTEGAMEMDRVDYLVVGFGVNVNTRPEEFPGELRGTATSVLGETGRPFSRVVILQGILASLDELYHAFRTAGFDGILARWKELTDMMGRAVTVRTAGATYTGTVVDCDRYGALVLRDEQGRDVRIYSGDVTVPGT